MDFLSSMIQVWNTILSSADIYISPKGLHYFRNQVAVSSSTQEQKRIIII